MDNVLRLIGIEMETGEPFSREKLLKYHNLLRQIRANAETQMHTAQYLSDSCSIKLRAMDDQHTEEGEV